MQAGPLHGRCSTAAPAAALLIIDVEDHAAAAEGFAASDPYAKAGLFESTVIQRLPDRVQGWGGRDLT